MTTQTESKAEQTEIATEKQVPQLIFVVEQFQGDRYREVAAMVTRDRARDAMSRMRYRLPGVPCRIVEKQAGESQIWNKGAKVF